MQPNNNLKNLFEVLVHRFNVGYKLCRTPSVSTFKVFNYTVYIKTFYWKTNCFEIICILVRYEKYNTSVGYDLRPGQTIQNTSLVQNNKHRLKSLQYEMDNAFQYGFPLCKFAYRPNSQHVKLKLTSLYRYDELIWLLL